MLSYALALNESVGSSFCNEEHPCQFAGGEPLLTGCKTL